MANDKNTTQVRFHGKECNAFLFFKSYSSSSSILSLRLGSSVGSL